MNRQRKIERKKSIKNEKEKVLDDSDKMRNSSSLKDREK